MREINMLLYGLELNKTKKGVIDKMAILGIVFLVIGVYLILDGSKK